MKRITAFLRAAISRARKLAADSNTRSTSVQLACAFSVLYGISYWSVPAALITGGLAGIGVIELRANARPKAR